MYFTAMPTRLVKTLTTNSQRARSVVVRHSSYTVQKSAMQDEELIELVKDRNVLYDLSHPKYMDPKYKKKIWEEIGKYLNVNETRCKSRWINIRDQFRRHISKKESKSGQSAVPFKKYKYEDNLQFLLPHLKERHTISNISTENEASESGNEGETPSTSIIIEPDSEAPSEFASPANLTSEQLINRKRKKNNDTESSPASQRMKYILEKDKLPQNTRDNAIDSFGVAVADTLKTFTPFYQNLAKTRIWSIVHEIELENLVSTQQTSTSQNS